MRNSYHYHKPTYEKDSWIVSDPNGRGGLYTQRTWGIRGAIGSARGTASTVVDVVAATNADVLKRGRWTKIAKSYKPNKQPKQE